MYVRMYICMHICICMYVCMSCVVVCMYVLYVLHVITVLLKFSRSQTSGRGGFSSLRFMLANKLAETHWPGLCLLLTISFLKLLEISLACPWDLQVDRIIFKYVIIRMKMTSAKNCLTL